MCANTATTLHPIYRIGLQDRCAAIRRPRPGAVKCTQRSAGIISWKLLTGLHILHCFCPCYRQVCQVKPGPKSYSPYHTQNLRSKNIDQGPLDALHDGTGAETFDMFFLGLLTTGCLATGWLADFVSAQVSTASFAYPPPGTGTTPQLIINVVDTITFQWTSNFNSAFLWVFCDEGKGPLLCKLCVKPSFLHAR